MMRRPAVGGSSRIATIGSGRRRPTHTLLQGDKVWVTGTLNLQELRESGHRKSSLWAAEAVVAWAGSALDDFSPNLTKRDAFIILIDEGVFALLSLLDLKKLIEYLRMKV
jgi:hypothetical protein